MKHVRAYWIFASTAVNLFGGVDCAEAGIKTHGAHRARHEFTEDHLRIRGTIAANHYATKDFPKFAHISFREAVGRAVAAIPGQAVSANLEVKDGFLVYAINVKAAGKSREVFVDAGDGEILSR